MLLSHIPNMILTEDNEILEEYPSMYELCNVIFSMDGDSALGPDCFSRNILLWLGILW